MSAAFSIDKGLQAMMCPLRPQELRDLEDSLVRDGCQDALVIWKEQQKLLDGHHRHEICERLDIPYTTREISLKDRLDAEIWIRFHQGARRNLTDDQRAINAAMLAAAMSRQAKRDRASKAGETGGRNHPKVSSADTSSAKLTQRTQRGRDKSAKANRVSERKVRKAQKVLAASPELAKAVQSGEIPLAAAARQVKRQKADAEIQEWNEKKSTLPSDNLPADVLLADPPWKYDFSETTAREIENKYPTATVEQIAKHIQEPWAPKLANDCVLFLWATAPKLREALQVMQEWGFEYRSHAVWDKQKEGMGYWFRGSHELLLVGVRGKFSPPEDRRRVSSVFREARTHHSAKPICVYEAIESMFPMAMFRAEMYQRAPREGWHGFGNEAT